MFYQSVVAIVRLELAKEVQCDHGYILLSLMPFSCSSCCLNMASCWASRVVLVTGASGNILLNALRESESAL